MLLKCADCDHDVNTEAKACPNCGSIKPFKNQTLTEDQAKGMSFSETVQYKKLGGKIEMAKGQKIFWVVFILITIMAIFTPSSTFLFFVLGAVAAYFTWKYLSAGRIEKGHSKVSSHLIGGMFGLVIWTIIIVIGVPKSEAEPIADEVKTEENAKTKEVVSPTQQYDADQKALVKYLNAVSFRSGLVDSIVGDVVKNLKDSNIVAASSSAKECADTAISLSGELSTGSVKPIKLFNEKNSDSLSTAIDSISTSYYSTNQKCKDVFEYLDENKPSLMASAQKNSEAASASMLIGMVGMMSVAEKYNIKIVDGEWKVSNDTAK